ncbi:ran-binding protein [Patellaria atrata CBS 101060]|uniref:Ran-binding protein n=1 Tax=Patellaria atrata CBS 101060 TaxID=1346257 RepID=A0A9P4SBF4_9PEZI|nr:ran-binding protein [Patellaria atrata CBS 101060]
MFRRSSYASVAAGTAASTSPQPFQSRPNTLSPMMNPTYSGANSLPYSTHHSRHPSRGMDVEGHHNAGSWGRGGQLPSYSSQYGYSSNGSGGGAYDGLHETFFIPSYLRGSRHMERLEEAYKARVAAQREMKSSHSNPGSLSASSSSVNLHKMVPSHRGMTHDIIERAPAHNEPKYAPLPMRWSESDMVGLELQADGLEVRFGGSSKTHDDAASIRADHCMPRQCGIYYYEVTVVSKGKEGLIGVGFSAKGVPLNRLPGWEPRSWAYHGDDGYSFCQTAQGKAYGPKFSTTDVIGCGINFRTNSAFFTKNGIYLGTAFKDILKEEDLYPSVGMKKPGEHLRVNFGQSPFIFDIDGMMRQEKKMIQDEINKADVASLHPPLDETALIHELIAQYLAHDGYVETARAFAHEVRAESQALANGNTNATIKELDPADDIDGVNRQRIRMAILDGDVDKALKYTKSFYPRVLRENENIYFKLKCCKFVEMARRFVEQQSANAPSSNRATSNGNATSNGHRNQNGKAPVINDYDDDVFDHQMELDDQLIHNGGSGDWERMDMEDSQPHESRATGEKEQQGDLMVELFKYGAELKTEFKDDPRRETKQTLDSIFAIIAYPDVRESPVNQLLDVSGRVAVAEELNGAILVSLGKSSSAALERLCQQSEALVNELAGDGGPGAFINVRKDFLL